MMLRLIAILSILFAVTGCMPGIPFIKGNVPGQDGELIGQNTQIETGVRKASSEIELSTANKFSNSGLVVCSN